VTGPPGTVPHEVPGSRSDSAATHVEGRKEPARTRVRFPAPPPRARLPHDTVRQSGILVPRLPALDREAWEELMITLATTQVWRPTGEI